MSGGLAAALYFLVPLGLTIIIEALVAAAFHATNEEQRALLLVNCVTNLCLSLLLYCYRTLSIPGEGLVLAALEILVVFAEWRLMRALCGKARRWLFFALACNAASFTVGVLLTLFIRF